MDRATPPDWLLAPHVTLTSSGEPFPKEITWYKKTGQEYEGLRNGTIGNYQYTIGYYGDMYLNNPDKSSSGYYKIQVILHYVFGLSMLPIYSS